MSPSTPHTAKRSNRVVQLLPSAPKKDKTTLALDTFLAQVLSSWRIDLDSRKVEGEHYLDWFAWPERESLDLNLLDKFSVLLHQELPALYHLLEERLSLEVEAADIEVICALQEAYLQLCERYNHLKLMLLDKMEYSRTFQIY